MKLLLLLVALSGCKTTYWHLPDNDLEPTECEGKMINPETQECLETEAEKRSYGVRK